VPLTFGASGVPPYGRWFVWCLRKDPDLRKRDCGEWHFIRTDHLSIFAEADHCGWPLAHTTVEQMINEFRYLAWQRNQSPEEPANTSQYVP
jgi:hypothetical protein